MYNPIHYVGPWTPAEKERVSASVSKLHQPDDDVSLYLGKPWICTCDTIGTRKMFAASRLVGGPRVFSAFSAEELADQIEQLALEHAISE